MTYHNFQPSPGEPQQAQPSALMPIVRIVLRYAAGVLLAKGLLPQEIADMIANDPELAAMVGVGIMAGVEGFYVLARRFGWSK